MKLFDKIRGRRSKKQLLEILLLNEEPLLVAGLCWSTYKLFIKKIINVKEFKYLSNFIENNRPKGGSPHFDPDQVNSAFYWPQGQWKPRKLWLEDLIKYQRPIKELLCLTLTHGKQYIEYGGLCVVIVNLMTTEIINKREYKSIMKFVITHKPKPNSKHYVEMRNHLYFWPQGEWEPRKKWLEDQIKSL
jgi:hypothetical protein